MGNSNPEKKKDEITDREAEDTEEEIEDWCESFVGPEDEMTDADKQVSQWCRLESDDKKKKEDKD